MPSYAVLGCGPAGLIAADLLAELVGKQSVKVYSKRVKSVITGAQFMHEKIGWYCDINPDFHVNVIKVGTAEGYAENVYGDPTAPTSWDNFFPGTIVGWDMKKAYDRLWDKWKDRIQDITLTPEGINKIIELHDMTFSTVPLRAICYNSEHAFRSQEVHIFHQSGESSLTEGVNDQDTMYYNGVAAGSGGHPWYRFSQLNKYQSWEFSDEGAARGWSPYAQSGNLVKIVKPVDNDCDCYPMLFRIGRYGAWDKKILTHHVPNEVRRAVQ